MTDAFSTNLEFFAIKPLRRSNVLSIVRRGTEPTTTMYTPHAITMFQTEVADAARWPHAANLLGSRRPVGSVSVFARRRAR
jgi:hypothetical protein